jgi:adenylate cyclase
LEGLKEAFLDIWHLITDFMVSARRIFWIQLIASLICTCLVIACISTVYMLGKLKRADHFLYDLHMKWRGPVDTSGTVVLVLMDEKSAIELNKSRGHWSRKQLADALNNLCKADAEIIGLDMSLSSPDRNPTDDHELAKAIYDCNNIVLSMISSTREIEAITALPIFQEGMIGDGFIDLPTDEDEVLRRISYLYAKPMADGSLQLIPAFSLELVRAYLNIDFALDFSLKDHIRLGAEEDSQLLLPYPELLINFTGDYRAFPRLSYADVVKNRFSPELVKGKIVIIGNSLAIAKDVFSTPYSRFLDISDTYKEKFGKIVKGMLGTKDLGVACHAYAVETILSRQFIQRFADSKIIALIIIFGIIGLLFYIPRIGIIWTAVLLSANLAAIVGISHLLFIKKLLWVEIAPPMSIIFFQFVTGNVIQKYFDKKKSALVKNLFGKYVSPSVVEELIKGDLGERLEGDRQDLTILFSDLRNFTSLSEEMEAREIRNLLNNYFDTMIPVIFQHDGTLDKLMGDAIMAFFGAPMQVPQHPVKAAEAALEMIAKLQNLKKKNIAGIDRLDAGIGINSGVVTIGNLGSHDFMDYTIIGDSVNIASRLEGLNKVYGTNIILSEYTASRLDERFLLRELDRVRVKGKGQAMAIYQLIGYRDEADKALVEMAEVFKNALDAFREQKWDLAKNGLQDILKLLPADKASKLYLERIQQLQITPPEEGWEGVTDFDHK